MGRMGISHPALLLFKLMNTCIHCGNDYPYDSNDPKGASAAHCPKCRKRQSKKNKIIELLNIACNGNIMCRKCGYRNPVALSLFDGVMALSPPTNDEQRKIKAKTQYALCLNCAAEVDAEEVEVKVINSKVTPIQVEFYERKVVVIRQLIQPAASYTDAEIPEVVSESGDHAETRRAKTRALESPPIEVHEVQSE